MPTNASRDDALVAALCASRSLQATVQERLDVLSNRIDFLTAARQHIREARCTPRSGMKRPREDITSRASNEAPTAGPGGLGIHSRKSRERVLFVGHEAVPVCSWDRLLDEALTEETSDLGTSAMVSFDAATWTAVCARLSSRVGFAVCTPMACYLRFRQLNACSVPFGSSEDALVRDLAGRLGWRWRQVALRLFSLTKRFRSPLTLAQHYMTLHPGMFWDTYLNAHLLWENLRPLVHAPFVDAEGAVCIDTYLRSTRYRPPRWIWPVPKMAAVHRALEYGVVETLRRVSPLSLLEMLLCFIPDRLPITGVSLDDFSRDASSCVAQLSLGEMAVASDCGTSDVRRRIERALLDRPRSPLSVNLDEMSRQLFGHTKCARIIFDVACQLQRGQPLPSPRSGFQITLS